MNKQRNRALKKEGFIKRIEPWLVLLVLFCILIGGWLMLYETPLIPLIYNTLSEKLNHKNYQVVASQSTISSLPVVSEDFRYFLPQFMFSEDSEDVEGENNILQHHFDKVFQGINFSENADLVTLKLSPGTDHINGGQSIEVSFSPDDHCKFGDGNACTYVFPSSLGKKVVFVSVHSGLGREADALRDMFEGTGINRGLYSVSDVRKNIESLAGSAISLTQGDQELDEIKLLTIIRIPPAKVAEYRSLPVEQTLTFAEDAAGLDPGLHANDLLVLETCGWRLPDDKYVDGLENLTYSVYLVIMGRP